MIKFKNRDGFVDNPFSIITEKMLKDNTLTLHLAVDSKKRRYKTTYIVALVLYSEKYKKGAEVIWGAIHEKRNKKDTIARLWHEVELASQWANTVWEHLEPILITRNNLTVHLDLNPNKRWKSSAIHDAGQGWLAGEGFNCVTKKNNENWAVRAADHFS